MTEPEAIIEYFDILDERINTIRSFEEANHHDEALLLCCAYLDSLAAHRYRNTERSHASFVRLLKDHGCDTRLGLVHPLQFLYALDGHRSKWTTNVLGKIRTLLMSSVGSLYAASDFERLVFPLLSKGEQQKVHENLWRGTLASIIYVSVRCSLVHGIAPSISPHRIDLSSTMWNGRPLGALDFDFVHPILVSVARDLRKLSIGRGKLFGHGFR